MHTHTELRTACCLTTVKRAGPVEMLRRRAWACATLPRGTIPKWMCGGLKANCRPDLPLARSRQPLQQREGEGWVVGRLHSLLIFVNTERQWAGCGLILALGAGSRGRTGAQAPVANARWEGRPKHVPRVSGLSHFNSSCSGKELYSIYQGSAIRHGLKATLQVATLLSCQHPCNPRHPRFNIHWQADLEVWLPGARSTSPSVVMWRVFSCTPASCSVYVRGRGGGTVRGWPYTSNRWDLGPGGSCCIKVSTPGCTYMQESKEAYRQTAPSAHVFLFVQGRVSSTAAWAQVSCQGTKPRR